MCLHRKWQPEMASYAKRSSAKLPVRGSWRVRERRWQIISGKPGPHAPPEKDLSFCVFRRLSRFFCLAMSKIFIFVFKVWATVVYVQQTSPIAASVFVGQHNFGVNSRTISRSEKRREGQWCDRANIWFSKILVGNNGDCRPQVKFHGHPLDILFMYW